MRNELKIGNKFWRHNCIDEVVEIRDNGIIGLDNLRGIISFSEIKPISLTEEILNKNFELNYKRGADYWKLNNNVYIIRYRGTNDFIFRRNGVNIMVIEYVHDLQNLFKILQKKKLELKP